MRLFGLVIFGLALTVTAPASAYTVKGALECPQAIEEDGHEQYREYNKWWLLGYFTARNYNGDADVGRDIEDDTIYSLALSFCKQNPANDWDDAAMDTYNRLQ